MFLVLLTALSFSASAQNDSSFLVQASRSLTDQFNNSPVEKVYLHLDKPAYNTSDTIWFKAYTVIGEHHQLSALSGVLYCELINPRDSVINRKVVRLIAGMGWSDFILSSALKPGSYRIRAYTNWMRNAGPDYFYNQEIRVGGLELTPPTANQTPGAKPDVQFFPEGGSLVNGIRSRVSVKCVNANGMGEDIAGTVTDNDGNEVASFTTQHLGMGVFALIPQAGKTYKADIITINKSKMVIDLPKALEQGFTLAVNNNQKDSVDVKVSVNDKLLQAKQNTSFYLVAQSGGKIYYTTEAKLIGPVFMARIAKNRFPSGIVQFTLFSQEREPINERIAFIQGKDTVDIKLSSQMQQYSPRQKVKIDIDTKGRDLVAVNGSYSVAVINETIIQPNVNKEATIFNNLLLTSELKGFIEQPNYYFNNATDQTRSDLDLLMLTQGYRRFEWQQVLNNKATPILYRPEKGLELAGTIKTPSGKPVPNGKITFMSTRQNFLTDTVTDLNGNFKFTDVDLPDTAKIVLRARKAHNGSNVAIYVKQADLPAVQKSRSVQELDTKATLTPEMLKNISDYNRQLKQDSLVKNKQLKGVTITEKRISKPDVFNNYGTSLERVLDMKRVRDYVSLNDAIKALAPGLHSRIFFMDGLELYPENAGIVSTYSVYDIESVRIIDAGGYDLIHGGAKPAYIMITSKKHAGTDTTVLKTVVINAKKGNKPDLSSSSNLHGGGNADQVIMGDKMGTCVQLSDCLLGRVFGVNFASDGTPLNTRGGKMSVILNGVILDGDALNNINTNDVYSIEVLRSGFAKAIYGSSIEPGGALIITTKGVADPNYTTSIQPSGLITYPFKGYSITRKFYSPKYAGPKTEAQPLDLRSTIYWNPNIIPRKDGKADFEFYNADTKGTYRVVIEGIDDNGNLGRRVYRYKVE